MEKYNYAIQKKLKLKLFKYLYLQIQQELNSMQTTIIKPAMSIESRRNHQIDSATLQYEETIILCNKTRKEIMTLRQSLIAAKLNYNKAVRILREEEMKIHEKRVELHKELRKNIAAKQELEKVLQIDDLKKKIQQQKQGEKNQKMQDKFDGKKIKLSLFEILPLDIVKNIEEFLPYKVKIQMLEDTYKPLQILNKQNLVLKRTLIEIMINSQLSEQTKSEYNTKIYFKPSKTINDEIADIIYQTKQTNPELIYHVIKTMCILLKKNKKYIINYVNYVKWRRSL